MLRSTGFFRGIDCPFYAENDEGSGGRNGCNRPYCHFRHSRLRRSSIAAAADHRKSRELHAGQKEQGYDPLSPDVGRTQEQQNGELPTSGDLNGALELVNKAIEEVRSEVEREKRKLFQIEDEQYEPSDINNSMVKITTAAVASHLAYDPGSYQITSSGYNPTPGCSKYTLDTDSQKNPANSMEYVPTSLKKPAPRIQAARPLSPPPSPKYSTSTSSSKSKYTVDNCRPSTDMEYDPLSNFSSRIAAKSKSAKRVQDVKTVESKTDRLSGLGRSEEEDVVAAKKSRPESAIKQKYTFSESDGESSGTEYRPTSLSSLRMRKGGIVTVGSSVGVQEKERAGGKLSALSQRNKDELRQNRGEPGKEDVIRRKDNRENEKLPCRTAHEKRGTATKEHKSEKDANKTSSSKSGSSSIIKDKGLTKKLHHDSTKKENKSHKARDGDKSKGNAKPTAKVREGVRDERKQEGTSGASSRKRERDAENRAKESKKIKTSDKEHGKQKEHQLKNVKQDGSRIQSERKSSGKSNNDIRIGKGSPGSSRERVRQSSSPASGKAPKQGPKDKHRETQSLSHVDLFGAESPDEAEPLEVDDDDDEEEVLVRKSANACKRGRLSKRKASELTPSSSEDERESVIEVGKLRKDEVFAHEMDFSGFQDLDFDSDPMEECLRIFNESNDVKREDKGRQAKEPCRDLEDKSTESTLTTLFPGQKKRVSHFAAKGNTDTTPKTVVRPYRRPTAQEVCYKRMQMAQQQAAQLSATVKTTSHSPSAGFSGERKRIAHRPNPLISSSSSSKTSLADSKSGTNQTHPPIKSQTTAGILSKTSSTVMQKRVAHTPTMRSSSMKRPVIPAEFGAKVPTNIRQRYLNTFIDECLKFCPTEEDAFQMALDEEEVVYERSNTKNIYLNVAVNTLKKLRSKSSASPSPAPKVMSMSVKKRALSHEEVLGGRLAATTSFTVNRMGKQQEEKVTGAALYRKLKQYLLTEEQLQEHNYPRANPEASGKAIIYNLPEKKALSDPFARICCRCGAEYKVNIHGSCVRKEECSHHWGRMRRHKVAGGWETNYNCCSGDVASPGCQVAKQHVQDGRKESLGGYVSTFSKPLPPDGNAGVFALDCEMCYTKQGLELTRVTVINSELKVVYDTFVKPDSKVVDYNTRFSGVTQEDLESTTITLRDVQAVLLSMFSSETILMGHSLESDLLALKLIHSTVVDTAIVFPHRLGLPYKRALKNLVADHLKRIIQDNVEGHDSSEDASACMELMIWRLKEDAKVKR